MIVVVDVHPEDWPAGAVVMVAVAVLVICLLCQGYGEDFTGPGEPPDLTGGEGGDAW